MRQSKYHRDIPNDTQIKMKQQEVTDTKYNGWTNYATWRINLEIFDGYDHEVKDVDGDWCKEYAEDVVIDYIDLDATSLAASYALAFMADVNWHEIAESINEIQKQDVWEA